MGDYGFKAHVLYIWWIVFLCDASVYECMRAYFGCMYMFCKYINCLCSTRFLLTVNILCSSILELITIYITIYKLIFVTINIIGWLLTPPYSVKMLSFSHNYKLYCWHVKTQNYLNKDSVRLSLARSLLSESHFL